eukprot:9964897-Alexandrium_andersonii.AAC.1
MSWPSIRASSRIRGRHSGQRKGWHGYAHEGHRSTDVRASVRLGAAKRKLAFLEQEQKESGWRA